MLMALFKTVINIPIPDPEMAGLLFLGTSKPTFENSSEITQASHAAIVGLKIVYLLLMDTFTRFRLSFIWLLLFFLSLPVLLAVFAPILLLARSKLLNMFLMVCFVLGLAAPVLMLLCSKEGSYVGSGFYFWVLALLLLLLSRVIVLRAKKAL